MSEFIAEAQVVVRANTAPFVADFTKAVRQVEKVKVTVTVRANMTGFKADLIQKLATSTKGMSVKVPVRADMTGFKADLLAKLQASTKGVSATVGIKAGGVSRGGAAAATGGGAAAISSKALTAEQATLKAVEAGSFARARVTGLIDEQEKRLARIARQDAAIKAAVDAQTKAITEQNSALQTQALLVEKRARAERAITAGAFEKEAARRTGREPTAKAEAERAAKSTVNAELRAQEAVVQASRQAERNLSEAKIAAREKTVARLIAVDKAGEQKAINERERILRKFEALKTDIAGITPESIGALGREAGNEAAIRKRITVLTHTNTEAKKLLGDETVRLSEKERQAISAFVASTAAMNVNAASALKAAAAQTGFAATLANVRRAAIAQAASLTGLRGAALTAGTAFIAASAGIISIKKAVDLAAEMESRLSVFKVTAGATAAQMDEVHHKAIELGKDITLPAVSAADAAVALTELSKAGLGVEDAMDGAKGVLQLATAANITFEQATLLAANALNAFGLAGEEASHVADVFANSANASQGSIVDAGVALQQASAVIRQAGISFEEGQAALTLFARAGIRGSDAGTSLRTALIRLINPSEKAKEEINKLGLEIRDSQGNIDLGVFQQFADATRDMSSAQRDQALAIIFGQDAIRGAAILVREGNLGLEAQVKNMNKAGTAAEVASARTSGYAGALENLKNQIEAVAEEIGAAFLPGLTAVLNLTGTVIGTTDKYINKVLDLRKALNQPFDFVLRVIGQEPTPDDAFTQQDRERGAETDAEFAQRAARSLVTGNVVDLTKIGIESFKELKKEIVATDEALDDLFGTNFASGTSLDEATEKVRELVKEINDSRNVARGGSVIPGQSFGIVEAGQDPIELISRGSPEEVNKAVKELQELQEELQGGDYEAKKMAESIGELIVKIQEASQRRDLPPIKVPVDLRQTEEQIRGTTEKARRMVRESLREGFHFAGLEGSVAFQKAFIGGLMPNMTLAGAQAKDAFLTGFDPASVGDIAQFGFFESFIGAAAVDQAEEAKKQADAFGEGSKKWWADMQRKVAPAVKQAKNQVLGTERAQTEAQIRDDPQGEIKALEDREAVLRRGIARIDKAQQGGEPIAGGLEARTAFKERLEQTIEERKAIEESIKADAESKKADLKKAQDAADQAVLDALFPATRKLETRALVAEGTEGLKDDIAVAKAQIQDNLHRIAVINSSFKDRQEAAKLIADLRDDNIRLNQGIAEDVQGIFDAQRTAFDVKLTAAGAEGNVEKQIALTRNRIATLTAAIQKAIREGKGETKAIKEWKEERDERNQQLEEFITSQSEADRALAESIANLTGNVNPLLAWIDSEIKKAREVRREADKGSKEWKDAQADINNFRKQREDVVDQRFDIEEDFAQSILDLTGNKNPLLKVIDARIREAIEDRREAKKGTLAWKKAQTDINNLLKQREEVLGEAAEKTGTTAFDLLKQFTDVFNESAGSTDLASQPFISPADFTSDISKFLVRKPGFGKGGVTPKPGGKSKLELNDDRLVRSMDDLTNAFGTTSSTIQKMFTVGSPKGMLTAGNIDLLNRPEVKNPKGGVSTVLSFSVPAKEIGLGLGEVLLPQVVRGQVVSKQVAIEHARKTGQHLGVFKTPALADKYAKALHMQQQGLGTRGLSSTDTKLDRLSTALDRNTQALTGNTTSTQKATPRSRANTNPTNNILERNDLRYSRDSRAGIQG